MTEKIKMTSEKREELMKELQYLKTTERKSLAKKLEKEREDSISEDNLYLAELLLEKEDLEKRIEILEDVISRIEEIPKKLVCNETVVEVGSKVVVKDNGNINEYMIVTPYEANPEESKISTESPLGKAILNSKIGDIVRLHIRNKNLFYKILNIC